MLVNFYTQLYIRLYIHLYIYVYNAVIQLTTLAKTMHPKLSNRKNTFLRRLLSLFISPSQFDFWARQLNSTRAWDRCFARVTRRTDEAESVITLRLAPNRNFDGFMPGQHVNLTAIIDGCRVTRSYSFSNIPNSQGSIELTVKREPKGVMSRWLFEHAHVETVLELDDSFGEMTSADFGDEPLVLLAAGSGITPIMSLLREQVLKRMPRTTTLVYWVRNENDLCFESELRSIDQEFKNFTLHTIITSKEEGQRISSAQLEAIGISLIGSQVLACGGGRFVDQARLSTSDAKRFQAEAFSAPEQITEDELEEKYTIELLSRGRNIEVSNQHTLLEALELQGISVAAGCRMGICNTCSCSKARGATQSVGSKLIDIDTNKQVRLCVTKAASNLQLAI